MALPTPITQGGGGAEISLLNPRKTKDSAGSLTLQPLLAGSFGK